MKTKAWPALFLAALLCFCAAKATFLEVEGEAVPTAEDLSRAEALAIAMEQLAARTDVLAPAGENLYDFPLYGIEDRALEHRETFVTLADGSAAWIVSFAPADLPVFGENYGE